MLGFTLFASPVAAQVFNAGPSSESLFDVVINARTDSDIVSNFGSPASIGSDGLTTKLNFFDTVSVGDFATVSSGTEIIFGRGSSIGDSFTANPGSELIVDGGGSIGGNGTLRAATATLNADGSIDLMTAVGTLTASAPGSVTINEEDGLTGAGGVDGSTVVIDAGGLLTLDGDVMADPGNVALSGAGVTNNAQVSGPAGVIIDAGNGTLTNASGAVIDNGGGSAMFLS